MGSQIIGSIGYWDQINSILQAPKLAFHNSLGSLTYKYQSVIGISDQSDPNEQ
jgi:hypothetical protein